MSPLRSMFLLGALLFSKIVIFIKILYSLGIRFANFELVSAKEKLEIVKSRGEAAPNSGGLSRRNAFGLIQEYCTDFFMNNYRVSLLSKREVAERTFAFEFEKPPGFDFLPGQYLDLKAINPNFSDPEGAGRDFSIAGAPSEENLLIVTRLRNAPFKNFLKDAPLGTPFQIKGPSGSFVLPARSQNPIVLIAGGIGIAPFRSMIKQETGIRSSRKIFLFYSNRSPEGAPFLSELKELEKQNSNFKFIPTMTKSDWDGEQGYINAELIKKYLDNISAANYYIAGPPAFVQSMWQMLKLGGINEDNIRTEEFAGY